jgi:ribosomal 50S subunit-recycling heat shock protein
MGLSACLKHGAWLPMPCNDNRVKYQEESAKPGKNVHLGDIYDVRTEGRKWRIKVTGTAAYPPEIRRGCQILYRPDPSRRAGKG